MRGRRTDLQEVGGGGERLNWLGNDRLIRNPNEEQLASLAELGDEMKYVMDTDGNVYDFCFDWYDGVSRTRTKKPLGISGLIEGVSKAELQTKGLTYLPADKATQAYMFIEMLKFLCSAEENLQTGKAYWLDFGHEMSYLAQTA